MERQLQIRIKPFSLRHRNLVSKGSLPDIIPQARRRLWTTLSTLNETFYYSTSDNPNWNINSSDIEQTEDLYIRLLGLSISGSSREVGSILEERIIGKNVEVALDVLECFLAWIEPTRFIEVQTAINDVFRDYVCQWRMSEGQAFLLDNEFMEDTILSEVSPLLALASFGGAKNEFQRARNELTEGNIRDAIFYAGASVESVYKAALDNSPKTGMELPQAYANANFMGLPKPKAQALQKALMPTATLRNELAGHGHGSDTLDIPPEYGELAINLAAAINMFISRQHLRRMEASCTPPPKSASSIPQPNTQWDDDDIPF